MSEVCCKRTCQQLHVVLVNSNLLPFKVWVVGWSQNPVASTISSSACRFFFDHVCHNRKFDAMDAKQFPFGIKV